MLLLEISDILAPMYGAVTSSGDLGGGVSPPIPAGEREERGREKERKRRRDDSKAFPPPLSFLFLSRFSFSLTFLSLLYFSCGVCVCVCWCVVVCWLCEASDYVAALVCSRELILNFETEALNFKHLV
jgi:hypothetical protein